MQLNITTHNPIRNSTKIEEKLIVYKIRYNCGVFYSTSNIKPRLLKAALDNFFFQTWVLIDC